MSRQPDIVPVINVTPMIDVLLVLLIIFMTIGSTRPAKYEARIPERPAKTDEIICWEGLLVRIDGNGKLFLNMTPAESMKELETLLQSALDGRPDDRKAVFIKAPRSFEYGKVIEVIDVMKTAGSSPIGLQIEDLEH